MARTNDWDMRGRLIGLFLLLSLISAPAASDSSQSAAEALALRQYEAANAAGRHAEATRHVLDYMEKYEGENAPLTVALTQRYGNLLRDEGDISGAIEALKQARERAIVAHGEYGMELFTINLDLGEAYVDRDIGFRKQKDYFDDALKVLRENGQHESLLYIQTLVGVASRLAQSGVLDGALGVDFAGVNIANPGGAGFEDLVGSGLSSVTHSRGSGYPVLEEYLAEAEELAETLEIGDPFLTSKIAIVRAKTRMSETIYLEAVPVSIRGSVTGEKIREEYQQADDTLLAAIDTLSQDAVRNQQYLEIANSARMDVAWLSKDMNRMTEFCAGSSLNMASQYSSDRLYEIEADGTVVAPRFPFLISTNIFRRAPASNVDGRGPHKWDKERKPQFVPVCINGRLMAALINSPKVSIEEID